MIEYFGLLLTEDSLNKISQFFHKQGIKTVGPFQENMHLTLAYFGYKSEVNRTAIPENHLGRTVELTLDAFGMFEQDGMIQNMGFRVDEESLAHTFVGKKSLIDLFSLKLPHITVAISEKTDEKGRRIAKAVNTSKCKFKKLDKPLVLTARLAVFNYEGIAFKVEN